MKNILLVVAMLFSFTAFAGMKEDSIALAQKGLKHIQTAGEKKAFADISSGGDFKKGELYVFVIDFDGKVLAHIKKPLLGKSLLGLKDKNGKAFAGEFVSVAKNKGKGWVDYWWPKPNEKKPSQKTSYIERVPGKNYFVGVGYYK